jgi:uncharacterized membrane protein YraQ (UPF0718 family)
VVALARSLFRRGANFTAAIIFQFASTNLVIELGIVMAVLLGWQFTTAEFIGGPIMIVLLWLIFRGTLRPALVEAARRQAERGATGRMEGHAAMDMSVPDGRPLLARAVSPEGLTAISHYFVSDWAAVWMDIAGGLLIAGVLAAWVPDAFWRGFFLVDHPWLARIWGPLIGPVVAIVSFVCSVGNVPLAAAGFVVDALFQALGLVPAARHALVVESHVSLNYTSILNIVFLALAALLVWRFLVTGGPRMLKMMNAPASASHQHHHDHHHHHPDMSHHAMEEGKNLPGR